MGMATSQPKRIELLPEPAGDVVAWFVELGSVTGEFFLRGLSGEIDFRYAGDSRSWYVNRSMDAFAAAVAIFNPFCALHADDEDTDDPSVWAAMAAHLRAEFARIEPLGDAEHSLWSATVEDAEGGLLSLC